MRLRWNPDWNHWEAWRGSDIVALIRRDILTDMYKVTHGRDFNKSVYFNKFKEAKLCVAKL